MPDYVIGIRTQANLTSLEQAVKKISDLEKELTDLKTQLTDAGKAGDTSAQGIAQVADSLAEAAPKAEALRENLRDTATEAKRAGTEIKQALESTAGPDNFNYDDVFKSIFSESGLADAKQRVNQLGASLEDTKTTGASTFGPLIAGAARFVPVAATVTTAIGTAKDALLEFVQQQKNLQDFEDTALLAGLDPSKVRAYREEVSKLSKELSVASGVAREELTSAFTALTEEGLDPEALNAYASALQDLLRITRGDTSASVNTLSEALKGNFEAFRELGIITDDTLDVQARMAQATAQLAVQAGRLADNSNTLSGSWDRLKANGSQVSETLGQAVSKFFGLQTIMNGINGTIDRLNGNLSNNANQTDQAANSAEQYATKVGQARDAQLGFETALENSRKNAADLTTTIQDAVAAINDLIAKQGQLNSEGSQLELAQVDANLAAGAISAIEAEKQRAAIKRQALEQEATLSAQQRAFDIESAQLRLDAIVKERQELERNAASAQSELSYYTALKTPPSQDLLAELERNSTNAKKALSEYQSQQAQQIPALNAELERLQRANEFEQQRNTLIRQRNALESERSIDSAATREAQAIASAIADREKLNPQAAASTRELITNIQALLNQTTKEGSANAAIESIRQDIRALGSGSATESELQNLENSLRRLKSREKDATIRQLIARVDAIQASQGDFDVTGFRDRAGALNQIASSQGVDQALIDYLARAAKSLNASPASRNQFTEAILAIAEAIRTTQAVDPADTQKIIQSLPNAADKFPGAIKEIQKAIDRNIEKNTQAAATVDQLGNTIATRLATVSDQLSSALSTLNNRLNAQQDQITQLRRRGTIS